MSGKYLGVTPNLRERTYVGTVQLEASHESRTFEMLQMTRHTRPFGGDISRMGTSQESWSLVLFYQGLVHLSTLNRGHSGVPSI